MNNKQRAVMQPIFDTIWERARHPERAMNRAGLQRRCLYRVDPVMGRAIPGNACFIGACIRDESYSPTIEGAVDRGVLRAVGVPPEHWRWIIPHLRVLQRIHDNSPIEAWQDDLRLYAEDEGLTVPGDVP